MRISLKWLKEFVDFSMNMEELAHTLTMLGLEIEAIEHLGKDISGVKTGKILSMDPHPDADKLVVCKTDVGDAEPLQIVCGAKNMKPGDIVPTALIGATLPGGFEIAKRKMRGIESQGMMCSARELGLGEDHSGLMILPPDTPIGENAKTILGLDDTVFEIEVTPNRGDWASMIGVARELAAYLGTTIRVPELVLTESLPLASSLSSVTIEDPDLCLRYVGRVLTDITISPSPEWMVRRLQSAGIRPINNVVDVTNYVLLETGHPLHAFDYDLLKENRIVVRTPRAGERITTLDGQDRELKPEMLIIADAENPVAIAGIMGGQDSEVTEKTTRIFLESACFKPASVRKTSRQLMLQSEASVRFQRGADQQMAVYAVNRAAMLMQQLAGGHLAEGLLDTYPVPICPNEVTLRFARTEKLLGTPVDKDRQCDILKRLGFECLQSTEDQATFRAPTWRHDVSCEADLIEEVARLYGYSNIELSLPRVRQTEHMLTPLDSRVKEIRHFMAENGVTEFFNWTFSAPDDVKICGLPASYLNMVFLQNPLSEKQATMRSSLLPGLMACTSRNVRHGMTDILAFELGPIFVPIPDQGSSGQPAEPLRLSLVASGNQGKKHWSQPLLPLEFSDLKGHLEAIMEYFGVEYAFDDTDFPVFLSGQRGGVLFENKTIGYFGQVDPKICRVYDIEQPVFMFELDLEPLLTKDRVLHQFSPIPVYPPSRRDLAVLVDNNIPAGDIVRTAQTAGGALVKSVDLFDVYTGKQVPGGKKSIALSILFRSDERTLTDADIQKAFDRILKKVTAELGAELR